MSTETKAPFDAGKFAKMKAYSVYIGSVEDLSDELKKEDPTDEERYEDIGEHRIINLLAPTVDDVAEQVKGYLSEGEYFMGAVVTAVFEHNTIKRIRETK